MPPAADLVMMSKADTVDLYRMTQYAIDTAREGAKDHDLTVTVFEQNEQAPEYDDATTHYRPGDFNYNRFANWGANMGTAPRIVVANNDLIFTPGWLGALIAADYPIVSPIDPTYPRQQGITQNEKGWLTGKHLSGWCFMITRSLWADIGGLDETYGFWCADDALIEQLRARSLPPMIVPSAQVHHLMSVTLSSRSKDEQDDLTWRWVHKFNQATGAQLGATNRHYVEWKRRNAEQISS